VGEKSKKRERAFDPTNSISLVRENDGSVSKDVFPTGKKARTKRGEDETRGKKDQTNHEVKKG